MSDMPLALWKDWARRDDWHRHFDGSDIRQLIGEIERLRRDNEHSNDLVRRYRDMLTET